MKIYVAKGANPRRVTIYLAEKGIDIEQVLFEPPYAELKSPEFLAKNPAGKIPVLELDDGTCLSESAAIVEYLEELYPTPPMIGTTPLERAQVRALERIGTDMFSQVALYVQHRSPTFMASRGLVRYPDLVNAMEPLVERLIHVLECRIGEKKFLSGENPSVADCTLFALMYTCANNFEYDLPDKYPRLRGWYERFSKRPSAKM
jgi:glutathione S-transferase